MEFLVYPFLFFVFGGGTGIWIVLGLWGGDEFTRLPPERYWWYILGWIFIGRAWYILIVENVLI